MIETIWNCICRKGMLNLKNSNYIFVIFYFCVVLSLSLETDPVILQWYLTYLIVVDLNLNWKCVFKDLLFWTLLRILLLLLSLSFCLFPDESLSEGMMFPCWETLGHDLWQRISHLCLSLRLLNYPSFLAFVTRTDQ